MGEVVAMLAGFSAMIGHKLPIYLNFHGGVVLVLFWVNCWFFSPGGF
jgi:glycerol-3-phosphate acyltransferase PlsY